jgi:spore germination cell wall hydrolase CwlJ-like protein
MTTLRDRLKGARFAPFSFVLCLLTILPNEIGYQDIASLLARQPGVSEHWQQYIFGSARRAMQVASFDLPRPIGTYVPETVSVRLASLDSQGIDITGSINPLGQILKPLQASDFPKVVRNSKGDRLPLYQPDTGVAAPASPPEVQDPATSNASVPGAKTAGAVQPSVRQELDAELQAALHEPRLPQYESGTAVKTSPPPDGNEAPVELMASNAPREARDGISFQTSSLLFGNNSFGPAGEALERWQPGEEPVIVMPNADPEMKQLASLPAGPTDAIAGGESVAGKGEVTGENQRPRTPAERLELTGASRAKAEKCMTEVIYFEARGEAVRGQIAVAQVVINRVFSGYYPNTVCGVVYQNKQRHLACQFTFACDDVRDVVDEPDMWERAQKISKAMLDGQIWLPEVGKSTHYHAYWVRPSWARLPRPRHFRPSCPRISRNIDLLFALTPPPGSVGFAAA